MSAPVFRPQFARASQVARVQQLLDVVWLLMVVSCFVWWHAEPAVAWMGAGLLVILPSAVLALQFGLSVGISRAAGRSVPWSPALLTAWWREAVIAAKVFMWRQPWRWAVWPDRLLMPPATSAETPKPGERTGVNRRGVLLVHGFMCNRGLWNGWHADLAARQHPVVAVNLEPYRGDIENYVPVIEQAVATLRLETGQLPLVVAHSMGGLAVRAWLRATPGAQARVAHVVTLGTPHQGTWLARWGWAANARQMQLASPWLQALGQDEPHDIGRLFTCWHSCADNIVFPVGTAVLPGSAERYLPHVGHVALVDHPEVRAHVLAILNASGDDLS